MVIKEISPIDFYKRYLSYKKIIIIDVRTPNEYMYYHLEDSINIPINNLLKEYHILLDKSIHYYLVCNDGKTSKYVSTILQEEGYNVTRVVGGLRSWKGEFVS